MTTELDLEMLLTVGMTESELAVFNAAARRGQTFFTTIASTAVLASGEALASMVAERLRPQAGAGVTLFVGPSDVMRALGCTRRTAYTHLRAARGGRTGKTTVTEWEAYAASTFGEQTWDDRGKKSGSRFEAASTTPSSMTSTASPTNTPRERAPKRQPPKWLKRGSKTPLIPIVKPRPRRSTTA